MGGEVSCTGNSCSPLMIVPPNRILEGRCKSWITRTFHTVKHQQTSTAHNTSQYTFRALRCFVVVRYLYIFTYILPGCCTVIGTVLSLPQVTLTKLVNEFINLLFTYTDRCKYNRIQYNHGHISCYFTFHGIQSEGQSLSYNLKLEVSWNLYMHDICIIAPTTYRDDGFLPLVWCIPIGIVTILRCYRWIRSLKLRQIGWCFYIHIL